MNRLLSHAKLLSVASALLALLAAVPAGAASGHGRLPGHVPTREITKARWMGRLPAANEVSLTFSLPLRNQAELDDLLQRLYDPADPMHGRFLTQQQFTQQFAPTQADYDAVADYARSQGLKVTRTHANRMLLNVSGPAARVESAFDLQLHQYQAPDGRSFHAPDNDPGVPDTIASRIVGVFGLDSASVLRTHSHFTPAAAQPMATPYQIGSGPGGGMTPNDIKAAYNLNGVAATGVGQTLALFELDGYNPADVAAYARYFGLPSVPLQNVLVDGYSGAAGAGAGEVTLDIELQLALAPGASRIIVYEGPNSGQGVLDTYNRIATDNLAKQVSTSWGLSEGQSGSSFLKSENAIFQQMAAQGQTLYAAAGDSGAYDNGSTLSVDDPASQPYVVGVGGTRLYVNSDRSYNRESAWNVNNTVSGGAGGGGVSAVWGIPSWQQKIPTVASSTMRNVPDVSLNADQNTGYAIYFQGGWYLFGGTSCASPLWAAFTARINQQRAANGMQPLGFANPLLYQIAAGTGYGTTYHDVADSTTNLYYPAVTGYDNATGWGSFNGAGLFASLAGSGPTTTTTKVPTAPTALAAAAGNGTVSLTWGGSPGATGYNVYRGTAAGAEGTTPIKSGLTSTGFTDTVTNGVTYYYKVAAVNSAGTSALSGEASATPAAPLLTITAGPGATVSSTTAQVSWNTNLASSSAIRFGTSATNLNVSGSSSILVTSHGFRISGLAHKTTYYYQVSSTAGGSAVTSAVKSLSVQ